MSSGVGGTLHNHFTISSFYISDEICKLSTFKSLPFLKDLSFWLLLFFVELEIFSSFRKIRTYGSLKGSILPISTLQPTVRDLEGLLVLQIALEQRAMVPVSWLIRKIILTFTWRNTKIALTFSCYYYGLWSNVNLLQRTLVPSYIKVLHSYYKFHCFNVN